MSGASTTADSLHDDGGDGAAMGAIAIACANPRDRPGCDPHNAEDRRTWQRQYGALTIAVSISSIATAQPAAFVWRGIGWITPHKG